MKANILKLILVFLLSTVLHWSFANFGVEYTSGISVMFVFMFVCCVMLPPAYGHAAAFVSGLFLDFFGTSMFGMYAFTYTLSAMIIYMTAKNIAFNHLLAQVLTVFALSFCAELFYSGIGSVFFKGVPWHGFWPIITGSFINGILAVPMFALFRFIHLRRLRQ
ncbi:rod shape-determining protein MreD [Parelusimicrobium proximum]|uniref:rod shape-determining protein MreD n=1 Tax=Parelusimicrobium proximum TaxID=3228953 RepID=UPI003D185937